MIRVRINARGAVDCHAALALPLPAARVWGQLRDFKTYARSDLFHANIDIDGGVARGGAALRITHRFFIFQVERVGRICGWKELAGYSFSDLSAADPRRGFPHIFSYKIEPVSDGLCKLHIRVRGKWTAKWLPRWIVRLWLYWIVQHIARRVENRLLAYKLGMKWAKNPTPARSEE